MDDKTLKRLQEIEREILVEFDKFCDEHNIKYSLFAGTALGAVRHGGFIPWDDDVDVCMERSEYERFLKLWRENPVDGYYLQGTDDPNHEYIDFSKLRKNGTCYGMERDLSLYSHNGIYLDIFPLDRIPKDKKARKKFLFRAKLRMIYTRGYAYTKGGKFLELVSRILLLRTKKSRLKARNKLEKKMFTQEMKGGYDLMSLSCPSSLRVVFPGNMMDEMKKIDFDGYKVSLCTRWHEMLNENFGDYMTLPPEEERVCKHESITIDLGEETNKN